MYAVDIALFSGRRSFVWPVRSGDGWRRKVLHLLIRTTSSAPSQYISPIDGPRPAIVRTDPPNQPHRLFGGMNDTHFQRQGPWCNRRGNSIVRAVDGRAWCATLPAFVTILRHRWFTHGRGGGKCALRLAERRQRC